MQLTESQKKAAELRDCSLLVSAGAGSGKTAVLTQRIIDRLCDANDECDITDFLIVTFTNAAAKELSDRIRKKLSDAARENPTNKKILRNIALLPLAKISTINSFCYDAVKKNFQSLGLSPSVRIADEAEMKVLRSRIINETVNQAFENTNEDFTKRLTDVYEIFSGEKSDDGFLTTLLELDEKLYADISPESFTSKVIEFYNSACSEEDFFSTHYGSLLRDYSKQVLEKALSKLEAARKLSADGGELEKKYLPCVEQEIDGIKTLYYSLDSSYEKTRVLLSEYKAARLGSVRNYDDKTRCELAKLAKSECSDLRKELSALFCTDEKTLRACAYDCAQILEILFYLIKDFRVRLDAAKKDIGIVDFNDVEHMTLELLGEGEDFSKPSEIALSMRRQYKEIYIDEYQDVNVLQDSIFKLISSEDETGNEKSRFMVGDIKQSIYRFRGARPDIFKNYRDTFADTQSQKRQKRIFMQNNFRCAKSVIELTNRLFPHLMGKNYESGDGLIFSRDEKTAVNSRAQFIVSNYDKEAFEDMTSEEYEARIIASKILELTDNPKYTDSDGSTFKFKDMAVLARSRTSLKVFSRVFEELGIPSICDVGDSFYGKKEILLALCIINSVDNPLRDIYLAGFMRSVPGGFTDDELCIIKQTGKRLKLYQSLTLYANNGEDAKLCEKCREFITRLDGYRRLSRGKNAAEFLWELYGSLDLLNLCASPAFNADEPEVCADRRKNLLKLYRMARDFTKTSFRGLGAFIEYINGAMENTDEKAGALIGTDCVRLMTMHASKGLEFPVCFVSDLARDFKNTSGKTVFSYSDGIGMKLRDVPGLTCQKSATGRTVIDTPFRRLIALNEHEAEIQEEMRIFYVALTRARDYLFMTACEKNDISKIISRCYVNCISKEYSNASSFMEAVFNCIMDSKCAEVFRDKAGITGEFQKDNEFDSCLMCEYLSCEQIMKLCVTRTQYEDVAAKVKDAHEGGFDIKTYDELKELGGFSYSYDLLSKIPSKLTVSQLKEGLLDDDGETLIKAKRDLKKAPDFLLDEGSPKANESGTAMHLFMQFADYKSCENSGCAKEADRLFDLGFIDARTRKILNIDVLNRFFDTPFYEQIKSSAKVMRERRFNLAEDASNYSDTISPGIQSVLVQGVIDLYFINPDGTYTVVDFKTDRVKHMESPEEVLRERHSRQLKYYCRAVEEITGGKVTRAVLFSFDLMKPIEVLSSFSSRSDS